MRGVSYILVFFIRWGLLSMTMSENDLLGLSSPPFLCSDEEDFPATDIDLSMRMPENDLLGLSSAPFLFSDGEDFPANDLDPFAPSIDETSTSSLDLSEIELDASCSFDMDDDQRAPFETSTSEELVSRDFEDKEFSPLAEREGARCTEKGPNESENQIHELTPTLRLIWPKIIWKERKGDCFDGFHPLALCCSNPADGRDPYNCFLCAQCFAHH